MYLYEVSWFHNGELSHDTESVHDCGWTEYLLGVIDAGNEYLLDSIEFIDTDACVCSSVGGEWSVEIARKLYDENESEDW